MFFCSKSYEICPGHRLHRYAPLGGVASLRVRLFSLLAAIVVYAAISIFTLHLHTGLRWGVAPTLLRHNTWERLNLNSTSWTSGLAGGSRHQFWGGVNLAHHPLKGGLHEPLLDSFSRGEQVTPDSHSPSDEEAERISSLRSVLAAPELALQQGEWRVIHRHRLCQCFNQQEGKVALVGNGPISEAQRQHILNAKCIIRFNNLLSRADVKDRTDVWFVRNTFWPSDDLVTEEVDLMGMQVGAEAQAVVLSALRGSFPPPLDEAVNQRDARGGSIEEPTRVAQMSPPPDGMQHMHKSGWGVLLRGALSALGYSMEDGERKLLPLEMSTLEMVWATATAQLETTSNGLRVPSSGFVALLLVLDCLSPGGTVDLYGFNWSAENWEGHQIALEALFVRMLTRQYQGRVRVHPTPCEGYRTCGEAGTSK